MAETGEKVTTPTKEVIAKIDALTYDTLEQIWNSPVEYNIFRTKSGIVLIEGEKNHPPFNSGQYSVENEPIFVDGHSHPKNPQVNTVNPKTGNCDYLSLSDYMMAIGKDVKDVILLYPQGGLQIHFDSQIRGNSKFLQDIIENFLLNNQKSKKYKPNKESLPKKERLYYVINEFLKNNSDRMYEAIKDIFDYTAHQTGVTVRKYDLSEASSQETKDFLDLYNKAN